MSGVRDNLSGGVSRCSQISDLTVTIGFSTPGKIVATWTNPSDAQYKGVRIMYKTGGYPTSPTDGSVFYDSNDAPPVSTYTKTGFTDGTEYYLRAFAYTYKNATRLYTTTTDGAQASDIPLQIKGEIIFTESTVYTIPPGVTAIDVFLVGGGGGGAGATFGNDSYGSGCGGGGGYTKTVKDYAVTPGSTHTVIVGAGGVGGLGVGKTWNESRGSYDCAGYDGSSSSFDALSADGGKARLITDTRDVYISTYYGGGNGGSGGGAGGYHYYSDFNWAKIEGGQGGSNGSNGYACSNNTGQTYGKHDLLKNGYGLGQGTTTRAFEDENGTLYAGGGSGGTCTYGSPPSWGAPVPGTDGGGGAGGYGLDGEATQYGFPGTANSGGGGGGASGTRIVSASAPGASGGNGGSGIVIIRWGY